MLHIILTILKIIGILILVVLALLLVVTGVVLFVPIRYRVNGKKDEESFFVKAEVYWLLHLFRLKAVYPEPGRIIAKVFWFTVYDSAKEDEPEKTEKKKKSKREKKNKKEKNKKENQKKKQRKSKEKLDKKAEKKSAEKEQTEVKKEENQNAASTEAYKQNKKNVQNNAKDEIVQEKREKEQTEKKAEAFEQNIEIKTESKQTENEEAEQSEPEEALERGKIGQMIDKIKAIIEKILSILQNIRYTIRRFCDKIKEIWANIQYYMEVFGEEETKRAFSMCKQQLYRIWKNIRPQKCRAELKIGTGEPDTTGYILAVHGMLYPLIGNNIAIEPDFENQVVEGTVFIKGRITIFVLVCVAIKLYFDEDIRHFLKRFKREEV